jgi:kojibiose phosphorylase
VIFDLDGVITDTAEYHYLGWKRLADEEGLGFDREINDRLRGISRRASLQIILDVNERAASEEQISSWMERKNRYYVESLENISSRDLLPGAIELINELRAAGLKVGIGSASKNAGTVLKSLGISGMIDTVADGYTTSQAKPAPDLFLATAKMLGVPPAFCAVVEDAAAGIDAALAARMWAVGLGSDRRVGHAHVRYDNLDGVQLADLLNDLEKASWIVAEPVFDPLTQQHKETIFTIGNGYLGLRGSLEEGYPGDVPACFVHRLWDDVPTFHSELANIPYWTGVDIWVNRERFRLDRGKLLSYRRWLDVRTGTLSRRVEWQAFEDGPVVELAFERFTSLADAHAALSRVQVRALSADAALRIRAGLNEHVDNAGSLHWNHIEQGQSEDDIWLKLQTRGTKIDLGIAAVLRTETSVETTREVSDCEGQPSVDFHLDLPAGEVFTLDQYVGIVTSNESETPVEGAVQTAQAAASQGYAAAAKANETAWAATWDDLDVIIEGDIEAQQAVRFNLFQLAIAAPRITDRASIGPKTLSGFGYRHHVFWDTEIFILPLFTFTQPELARSMLMYRYYTLPGAREKARKNGYLGAQFAWESAADGVETTPTWLVDPVDATRLVRIWTGDIEIHITADVAYAAIQYWKVTGDEAWMRDYGAEIVLDGARFWASAAKLEQDGKYHYRNVIGPDEYHDDVDDNAFTNWMAKWHLDTSLKIYDWLKECCPEQFSKLREKLDLDESHLAKWAEIRDRIKIEIDPTNGQIEQFEGYFDLIPPDFQTLRDPNRKLSLQAILGIDGVKETQIIKQPDVLMLMYLLPDEFTPEQLHNNYQYYNPRTDLEQGSSLGPGISASMAARLGDIEEAYQHFMRAARTDLLNIRHNAGDGIHAANAGGLWQAVVFGFGGLQLQNDHWTVQPRLPAHWESLSFKIYHRGQLQSVKIPKTA